jgi:hypothetical protein
MEKWPATRFSGAMLCVIAVPSDRSKRKRKTDTSPTLGVSNSNGTMLNMSISCKIGKVHDTYQTIASLQLSGTWVKIRSNRHMKKYGITAKRKQMPPID